MDSAGESSRHRTWPVPDATGAMLAAGKRAQVGAQAWQTPWAARSEPGGDHEVVLKVMPDVTMVMLRRSASSRGQDPTAIS